MFICSPLCYLWYCYLKADMLILLTIYIQISIGHRPVLSLAAPVVLPFLVSFPCIPAEVIFNNLSLNDPPSAVYYILTSRDIRHITVAWYYENIENFPDGSYIIGILFYLESSFFPLLSAHPERAAYLDISRLLVSSSITTSFFDLPQVRDELVSLRNYANNPFAISSWYDHSHPTIPNSFPEGCLGKSLSLHYKYYTLFRSMSIDPNYLLLLSNNNFPLSTFSSAIHSNASVINTVDAYLKTLPRPFLDIDERTFTRTTRCAKCDSIALR